MAAAHALSNRNGAEMRRDTRPVALVTGAGRGIGRAIADEFVARGCAVVIAERARSAGKRAERALRAKGAPALFVQTDVAAVGAAERAVSATLKRFGHLDYVVNNAGVLSIGPVHRLARRNLQAMVGVNLLGSLLVTRAALPALRRRGRGAIVNIASLLGKEGIGDYVTYCATKFGIVGLTEALADELRGTRIGVWAVCPGQVDTAMGRKAGVAKSQRLIPPEHVARVVVALATRQRRKPSGTTVDVTR